MRIEQLLGTEFAAPIEGPTPRWQARARSTEVTEAALAQHTPGSCAAAINTHEKLIEENNLRSISYLKQALRVADAVVLVQVPGRGSASGFLVGTSLLLTNNHVLRDAAEAARARVRFNYERDVSGRLESSEYLPIEPTLIFHTNVELDYTLVGVGGEPGYRYGVIPIGKGGDVSSGSNVNIIQHPLGQPKQIAMVDNQVVYADDGIVQYLTDTMPGSSGSPVFNDDWELVALHHSGGWLPEPGSTSTHFRNEGIRISAIVSDLVAVGLAGN